MTDVIAPFTVEEIGAPDAPSFSWGAPGRFRRDSLRRRILALTDLAAVTCAALLLWSWQAPGWAALHVLTFLPGWLLVAKVCGLYDRDHRSLRYLTVDEAPRIAAMTLGGTAALTAVFVLTGSRALTSAELLKLWVLLAGCLFCARVAARHLWRRLTPGERALVVGEGTLAEAARRKLHLFPDIHVEVVRELGRDVVEELERMDSALSGVERLIVALPSLDEALLARLLEVARSRQMKLSVVPPMRSMLGTAVQLTHVAELPLVEYHTWDTSRTTMLGKRILDVGVSAVALVVLSPLLFVIGLALALSGGPVFFVQSRAGFQGRPFRMLKFRTMEPGADARLPELVDVESLDEPVFKLQSDPRVTRLGRILRRTSLDELPQLANVLRGEMSLVGPRPEQLDLVSRYRPEHRFRLEAKPGITGPMQVYGRGELGFEERLAVERDYIENVSLVRDLRIIALTVGSVLRSRGAF